MTQRAIHGEYLYFVTANVQNRRWFFVRPARAQRLGQAIQTSCQIKGFDLLAYCILPNHIHVLVRKMSVGETASQRTRGRPLRDEVESQRTREHNDRPLSREVASQRTLESVRCEGKSRTSRGITSSKVGTSDDKSYLFPHRRLSSRRCGPNQQYNLSDLMQSIKGSFSRSLSQGKFWQHRSNFRIIESEAYLQNVLDYISLNYQKMNLPEWYGQAPFAYSNPAAIARAVGIEV